MVDPIGDMFTRIQNAQRAKRAEALIPYSKMRMEVLRLLQERGVVGEVARRGKKNRRSIAVSLLYAENGSPRIRIMRRISRPSRRVYRGWRDLSPVRQGFGFSIVSTPQGILDDKKARAARVGGELLGETW